MTRRVQFLTLVPSPEGRRVGRRAPTSIDRRQEPDMNPFRRNAPRRRLLGAGLALLALWALAGCDGDDNTAVAGSDRPQVTFTADDASIETPALVPSGLVDVTLQTKPGKLGHHIFVARLNDGVKFQDVVDGDDDAFFTKMMIKGGNGTIAAGKTAHMTFDLEPGSYFVLDNPQNEESPTDEFTVVAGEQSRAQPNARGTVRMGPGMVIEVPDDFDGRGVWEFVNRDTEDVHEAAMVKLAAGKTGQDLADWFHEQSGPPPIDGEFGSMGALGPGQRAWMTLEPGAPGDYVIVCFVPGRDGIPHLAKGMFREFEVR
jgi:hypothetical protein